MADHSAFSTHANEAREGLLVELLDFVRHNRKYWLIPILAVLLALGALVLLGGTAAAPFIYTLF